VYSYNTNHINNILLFFLKPEQSKKTVKNFSLYFVFSFSLDKKKWEKEIILSSIFSHKHLTFFFNRKKKAVVDKNYFY